jgi:ABC-type sugar transport system ATPase subunit
MTALRFIAGFESPTQGRIRLDGQGLTNVLPNRCTIAIASRFLTLQAKPMHPNASGQRFS